MFWKKAAPTAPPKVETDTVVPFFFKDDGVMKGVCILGTWRFDHVLNPEHLRTSLESLIENHGSWRKLGARIRQTSEGKLEYHIPTKFDRKTRPSVDWRHSSFDMCLEDHPGGRAMPRPSAVPTTMTIGPETVELCAPDGLPQGVLPWIYSDRPLLIMHCISFLDATLVCVIYNHATMDGMALRSMMSGWCAVVNGREDQIPHFAAFDEDPLLPLASKTPGEKYALHHMASGTLALIRFALNFVRELVTYPSELRYMCIPGPYVEEMRRRATAEAKQETGNEKIWLSEGDVLTSWLAKTVISALDPPDDTPIALTGAMDIRDFAEGKIPRGSMYLGNAIDTIISFMSKKDLMQKSHADIALRTRRDTLRLRQQDQIEAKMQLDKDAKGTVFLGPSNQIQLLFSNWHRARFFDVDFSGALVPGSMPSKYTYTSTRQASFAFVTSISRVNLRNSGPIIGQDGAGNWWIMWRLRRAAWPAVEKALAKMECYGWHAAEDQKKRASILSKL